MERLRVLPDPRQRRGVRHPFVTVLLLAASAVVAGARSYAAIGRWAASAPQLALTHLLARLTSTLTRSRGFATALPCPRPCPFVHCSLKDQGGCI
ncbi:transposase family protein [Streptomyces lavendulae]|uniref:transposase family protein n=1 Tax=Streptomyces lavendulae TaxID=1914 RepID=UPI003406F1D4